MACDGEPSDVHNSVTIAVSLEAATRIGHKRAHQLGGELVNVELETDDHCFRTLEPEGWKRMEETRMAFQRLYALGPYSKGGR